MGENIQLNVDKKDFEFVEKFSKKHNIAEGNGNRNQILIIINSYKEFCKQQ